MLVPLPFAMFGEIADLQLQAHVYCPQCHTTRQIDPTAERIRHRPFAGARFRCTNQRFDGEVCGGLGLLQMRPAELLAVGGPVHLAFLTCKQCLPPWELNYLPIHQPPWAISQAKGRRFQCPGCRQPLTSQVHGPDVAADDKR
jgi:hypothetical protein